MQLHTFLISGVDGSEWVISTSLPLLSPLERPGTHCIGDGYDEIPPTLIRTLGPSGCRNSIISDFYCRVSELVMEKRYGFFCNTRELAVARHFGCTTIVMKMRFERMA